MSNGDDFQKKLAKIQVEVTISTALVSVFLALGISLIILSMAIDVESTSKVDNILQNFQEMRGSFQSLGFAFLIGGSALLIATEIFAKRQINNL